MSAQRVIEHYREVGIKSDIEVYALIKFGLLGTIVGTKRNCKHDDHVAPVKFLSDVLLGRVHKFILWANRSGSKSFFAGLITWIRSSFISRLETTILGGSFEQSEKSYKAMQDFWNVTNFKKEYLLTDPMKARTSWKNGSLVEVLAASTKSARGPHPHTLLMDEIDEMDLEVYESALSQPQSKHGIKASLGRLSTNHRLGGIMDQAVKLAGEKNTTVYKWCIWECLESCKDYSCSTCKLSPWCPGEHMKLADGYYKIYDFLDKLTECSMRTLMLEWFCEKIGIGDLVYGDFYDEERICGSDVPGFDEGRPVFISVDFGGAAPFSVGAWQNFPRKYGWVRIDEVYMAHTTNAKVIAKCKKRPWWKKVNSGVCDPSRKDSRIEWMETGIPMYKGDNAVDEGINAVRDAMDPVIGRPKFLVNRACKEWRREVEQYSEKNGKPVKEHDHTQDETRYFIKWKIDNKREPRIRRL